MRCNAKQHSNIWEVRERVSEGGHSASDVVDSERPCHDPIQLGYGVMSFLQCVGYPYSYPFRHQGQRRSATSEALKAPSGTQKGLHGTRKAYGEALWPPKGSQMAPNWAQLVVHLWGGVEAICRSPTFFYVLTTHSI